MNTMRPATQERELKNGLTYLPHARVSFVCCVDHDELGLQTPKRRRESAKNVNRVSNIRVHHRRRKNVNYLPE